MSIRADLPPHWIGLASDLAVAPPDVVVRRSAGCVAVHHPLRRDFHDLNALWPVEAPTPETLPDLLATWEEEFLGTGVRARVLCWEEEGAVEPGDSPWAEGESCGDFRLSRLETLRCTRPLAVTRAGAFTVRAVEGEKDWARVVDLNLAAHGFEAGEKADFCRWMIGRRHRQACESGRATWWAAWEEGLPIASAGLYSGGGGPARFQEVVTHRAHRRRGAATALLSTVLEAGAPAGFLLVADSEGEANRLYRRLGFEPVTRIRELFQRLPN